MTALWGWAGLLGLFGVFGLVLVRRRRRPRSGSEDPLARYPVAREPATPNADAAHTPLMTPVITPQMLTASAGRSPERTVPVVRRPAEPAPPEAGTIAGEIVLDHPEPVAPPARPEQQTTHEDGAVKTAALRKQATSREQEDAEPVVPRQQTTSPYESRVDSAAPPEEAVPGPEETVTGTEEGLEEQPPRDTEPAAQHRERHFDPRAAVRLVIHHTKKVLRR